MSFRPFCRRTYRELLNQGVAAGYVFMAFDDPRRLRGELTCLLRHDVDADLGAALEIARIDADAGVRSTFFVMIHSPLYNLFSRANHRLTQEILSLGHSLGLHFDEGFDPDERPLTELVRREADLLSAMFARPVTAVSFHQPSARILDGSTDLPGLVNTYSPADLPRFKYMSDSNGRWRETDPVDVFRQRLFPKLHLLLHPMWWVAEAPRSQAASWEAVVRGNWERSQTQLVATEPTYGRPRELRLLP